MRRKIVQNLTFLDSPYLAVAEPLAEFPPSTRLGSEAARWLHCAWSARASIAFAINYRLGRR